MAIPREKFKIQCMQARHVSEVHKIEVDRFDRPWSQKSFEEQIETENSFFSVCTTEGDGIEKVVGYIGLIMLAGEAHITNVAVCKAYERKGIGFDLLNYGIEIAREKKAVYGVTLEVSRKNLAAIYLYEKAGFAAEGIRKNYYGDGDDGIVMWIRDIFL